MRKKYKHIILVTYCLFSVYSVTTSTDLNGIKEPVSNVQNLWGQEFGQSKVLVAYLCSMRPRTSAEQTGSLGLISTRGILAHTLSS